jgi:hypothetical protein
MSVRYIPSFSDRRLHEDGPRGGGVDGVDAVLRWSVRFPFYVSGLSSAKHRPVQGFQHCVSYPAGVVLSTGRGPLPLPAVPVCTLQSTLRVIT